MSALQNGLSTSIAVTVIIEMPIEQYRAFIGRCLLDSREYEVLRNAIIDHVPSYVKDGNVAALQCSVQDARLLLERAKSFYPVAASYIEESLRSTAFRKADAGDTWHSSFRMYPMAYEQFYV